MDLQDRSRSATTLGVLALVFVLAALWAWHEVRQPFPPRAVSATAICEPVQVPAGGTIQTAEVLVNVLNAGTKVGLAQNTQAKLADFGFAPGDRGNTPHVRRHLTAEIWTDEPKGPATRLVASYFGPHVRVIKRFSDHPGITVVVGDAFGRIHRGLPSIKAPSDTTVCEPTANAGL